MSAGGGNPYNMPGMNMQMQMGAINPNLSGYGARGMNADGNDPAIAQQAGYSGAPNQSVYLLLLVLQQTNILLRYFPFNTHDLVGALGGYDGYGRANVQQTQKLNGYTSNGYGSASVTAGLRDSSEGLDPNVMMQGASGSYGTRQPQGSALSRPERGYSKPY